MRSLFRRKPPSPQLLFQDCTECGAAVSVIVPCDNFVCFECRKRASLRAITVANEERELRERFGVVKIALREHDLEKSDHPVVPTVNIKCEYRDGIVTGTTSLRVVRVEAEDDGSFTAVTDHWPSDVPKEAVTIPCAYWNLKAMGGEIWFRTDNRSEYREMFSAEIVRTMETLQSAIIRQRAFIERLLEREHAATPSPPDDEPND